MSNAALASATTVFGPVGPIEVREQGSGRPVVMLPSLGRGGADFDDLAGRLAAAGYRALCPEPRGIGGSTGELGDLTMADLADDVAAVIRERTEGTATLVGHAFGNRVVRMTATEHPELVERVALLCCGGMVPPAPEVHEALVAVFDPDRSDAEHLEAVRKAFFAPGNDPVVWVDGWHGMVAAAQGLANAGTPSDHWWAAGGRDVLVVQPVDDLVAVAENARRIVEDFDDRATLVLVPEAGHALLPEQPQAVADALLGWLGEWN